MASAPVLPSPILSPRLHLRRLHRHPAALPPPPALIPVTTHGPNSYNARWTSHVRARIGYAVDNWHFFVAGGFATANRSFHEGTITTTFVTDTSGGKYYGWSVGGGVEWAFTRNLFARVEYFYDDFGHKDYVGVTGRPLSRLIDRPNSPRRAGMEI